MTKTKISMLAIDLAKGRLPSLCRWVKRSFENTGNVRAALAKTTGKGRLKSPIPLLTRARTEACDFILVVARARTGQDHASGPFHRGPSETSLQFIKTIEHENISSSLMI